MEQFHYHLKFVIESVLKRLIRDEAKKFGISQIESNERIQMLDAIQADFKTNDRDWEENRSKEFQKLYSDRGSEASAQFFQSVMQKYGQIDWNEYGNYAFDRIKQVIAKYYICSWKLSQFSSRIDRHFCVFIS